MMSKQGLVKFPKNQVSVANTEAPSLKCSTRMIWKNPVISIIFFELFMEIVQAAVTQNVYLFFFNQDKILLWKRDLLSTH